MLALTWVPLEWWLNSLTTVARFVFRVANALIVLRGYPRLELVELTIEVNFTHGTASLAYFGGP